MNNTTEKVIRAIAEKIGQKTILKDVIDPVYMAERDIQIWLRGWLTDPSVLKAVFGIGNHCR